MLIIKYINKVQMNMHTMYQYFQQVMWQMFQLTSERMCYHILLIAQLA